MLQTIGCKGGCILTTYQEKLNIKNALIFLNTWHHLNIYSIHSAILLYHLKYCTCMHINPALIQINTVAKLFTLVQTQGTKWVIPVDPLSNMDVIHMLKNTRKILIQYSYRGVASYVCIALDSISHNCTCSIASYKPYTKVAIFSKDMQ